MGVRFQDCEDISRRKTWEERDGTAYQRTYNVPVELVGSGQLPEEGDPMPGEANALLGPFIEKDGISFGKSVQGNKQQVILKCKKLKARS